MKMRRILLVGLVGMSLSCSAIASAIKDKVFKSAFVEPAKVVQLKAQPELTNQPIEVVEVFLFHSKVNSNIVIYDYGGDIDLQVNSNKLAYRESNVFTANFAKEQNQNFERMPTSF